MIAQFTDVAVMKQLVRVIRYLTDTGTLTSFAHIGDIIDGTTATIHTSIVKHLDDKGIPCIVCEHLIAMVLQLGLAESLVLGLVSKPIILSLFKCTA